MDNPQALMLVCTLLTYLPLAKSHAFISKPTSKQGGDQTSYASSDFFSLSSWWVDRAHFNGDVAQTPWTKPGHFNVDNAKAINNQFFHPCGCQANALSACMMVGANAPKFGEIVGETELRTPPTWIQGGTEETSFNMNANHGGGYIYMLCSYTIADKCTADYSATTQERQHQDEYTKCMWECFNSNVLEFVEGSQALQYQTDQQKRVSSNSKNKTVNTLPLNSVWREIPIADTNRGGSAWDYVNSFSDTDVKTKFEADFGLESAVPKQAGLNGHTPHNWQIVDRVKIPTTLESGEYLLGWRYECQWANQIWTNCADVKLEAPATTGAPSRAPSRAPTVFGAPTVIGAPTSASAITNSSGPPNYLNPSWSHKVNGVSVLIVIGVLCLQFIL